MRIRSRTRLACAAVAASLALALAVQGCSAGPGRGPVPGPAEGSGLTGTDYIYSDRYREIAAIRAGQGLDTDFHEFLITPWNTALILADQLVRANLTSIGGNADQRVFNGIVEEVDIRTGRVLLRWDSADHVPFRDSHLPLPPSR
jgi:hypothetical protein